MTEPETLEEIASRIKKLKAARSRAKRRAARTSRELTAQINELQHQRREHVIAELATTTNQADLARRAGVTRSYITDLKEEERTEQ